jgi:ribonucleoside-diphosphate reductase beta chain
MSLTENRANIRPFEYPWAIDFWRKQNQVHWLPEEVPLNGDVSDFDFKLTHAERNLVTHIFRFFTQSDAEIADCYHKHYMSYFKPIEIQMMLSAFSHMETIHIMAYMHLLDTLGLPETEYSAFLNYKEMKDKFDWLHSFNPEGDPTDIAIAMAAFSGATEGMSLFASFAILLNFPRHNKLKGMGDIIAWSVRDESMHCEGIAKLFQTHCHEKHNQIDFNRLETGIVNVFVEAVRNEDAFIDLAFEMGPIEGLTAAEVKKYIRFIADFRLRQLGQKPIYGIEENPLPWIVEQLNGVEFGNFFESRPTEYSKAATEGSWDDAFDFDED